MLDGCVYRWVVCGQKQPKIATTKITTAIYITPSSANTRRPKVLRGNGETTWNESVKNLNAEKQTINTETKNNNQFQDFVYVTAFKGVWGLFVQTRC